MAVGKLPPKEETEEPGEGDDANKPGDVNKPGEGGGASKPGDVDNPDGSSGVDKPGDNTGTENNPDSLTEALRTQSIPRRPWGKS